MSSTKTESERPAFLLLDPDRVDAASVHFLQRQLENGTVEDKIESMKRIIQMALSGGPESLDSLLMFVIRFVLPVNHHFLRKLLHVYWEVTNKRGADGKLKQEFILVCNALRNDLIHPNEYVRGSTLRSVCKLPEPDILEPLVPSIRENLEDRHPFVRKNAVMALYHIYNHFDFLAPDAPETIRDFLVKETDPACKRNAFIMLCNCAQDLAVEYLSPRSSWISAGDDDVFQLSILELIRKLCRQYPQQRSKYMKIILELLTSKHPSVQFEAAGTLVSLSTSSAAVRAAASCYIELLATSSDQNVRLIVLDRLTKIKVTHPKVMELMVMDVLRALGSPNLDVRRKTLEFSMDLVSEKNVNDVVKALRGELLKSRQATEKEISVEYRQQLIEIIHKCSSRFPMVAAGVVDALLDHLQDSSQMVGYEIMMFLRDVIATHVELRKTLIDRLLANLRTIRVARVLRMSLWVISEYGVHDGQTPENVLEELLALVGPVPFVESETQDAAAQAKRESSTESTAVGITRSSVSTGPALLSDGTYATQSALAATPSTTVQTSDAPLVVVEKANKEANTTFVGLREFVMYDSFAAASLATALTKLVLHMKGSKGYYKLFRSVLLVLTSILRLGQGHENVDDAKVRKTKPVDNDTKDKILVCLRILTSPPDAPVRTIWLEEFKVNFGKMIASQETTPGSESVEVAAVEPAQPEAPIDFRLLKSRLDQLGVGVDEYEVDLSKAMGKATVDTTGTAAVGGWWAGGASVSKDKVHQMSGLGDDIYCEARVLIHEYDVVLDLLVANLTQETLQNVLLEVNTVGDLKLCEHPQAFTLGPKQTKLVTVSLKVSSTDTGIIFGSLSYNVAGASASNKRYITLNELLVDIREYIRFAPINDFVFRLMWGEYEWENKITVSTTFASCQDWLRELLKSTNMGVVMPAGGLEGSGKFLSANIYGRTLFGEDVVANVSVELDNEKVSGFVRIRAKTQGMAVSLGDRIVKVAHNVSATS